MFLIKFITILTDSHALTFPFSRYLEKQKMISTEPVICQEMESKLGQLFYLRADNFQTNKFIHPYYLDLIKKINPGGILLRRGGAEHVDPDKNWQEIENIKKVCAITPFISDDYAPLGNAQFPKLGSSIYKSREKYLCALKRVSILIAASNYTGSWNPAIEASVDIKFKDYQNESDDYNDKKIQRMKNVANDIAKISDEYNIIPTFKHFPFLPRGEGIDLHNESPDVSISPDFLKKNIIDHFANTTNNGFIMTTHAKSSSIDPNEVATTSKKWIDILKYQSGIKDSIIITDALDMINHYPKSDFLKLVELPVEDKKQFDRLKINPRSIIAFKSIMAGHDMITYQDDAATTEMYYKDLMKIACQNSEVSQKFQSRIRESFNKIIKFKEKNKIKINRERINLSNTDVQSIIKMNDLDCNSELLNKISNKINIRVSEEIPCEIMSEIIPNQEAIQINNLQSITDGLIRP